MPFEAPTAFHADAISYTRTIEESLTTNSQETTGWRGIVLPFDVSTIQARNKAGEQIELSAYNAEGEYDTSRIRFGSENLQPKVLQPRKHSLPILRISSVSRILPS